MFIDVSFKHTQCGKQGTLDILIQPNTKLLKNVPLFKANKVQLLLAQWKRDFVSVFEALVLYSVCGVVVLDCIILFCPPPLQYVLYKITSTP